MSPVLAARPDESPDFALAAPGAELRRRGYSLQRAVLAPAACEALAAGFEQRSQFRAQILMERHQYGRGEYRYFDYPLPVLVGRLRAALYRALLPAARALLADTGRAEELPEDLDQFLERCRRAGQRRPTPLLLAYGPGDYNRLHQDQYGELQFPYQAMLLLSAPGEQFTGGEFCLVFQRYRAQSRVEVVPVGQGDLVVFPVDVAVIADRDDAPPRRERVRHGVSRLHSGRRIALGLPLHDAR